MKIKLQFSLYVLGTTSLVLLPNHDLLNYLLAGTPLVIWKQALVGILSMIAIFLLNKPFSPKIFRPARNLTNALLLASVLPTAFAILVGDISLLSLGYGYFFYLGAVGAIYFGAQLRIRGQFENTLVLITRIGIFAAIIVNLDYFTDVFSFLPRQSSSSSEYLASENLHRAAGFFGTSTLIGPFLLLAVTSSILVYCRRRYWLDIFNVILALATGLPAIFLSGSRAALLTYLCVSLVLLTSCLVYTRLKPIWAFALALFPLMFIYNYLDFGRDVDFQMKMLIERYIDAFNSYDAGNKLRYEVWESCVTKLMNPNVFSLFGYGFGSSSATIGRAIIPHCESTFFQSMLEAGPFGLFIRFGPGLVAISFILRRILARQNRYQHLEAVVLSIWLVSYFAFIATSPTAGAFHNQFIYFMICGYMITKPAVTFQDHRSLFLTQPQQKQEPGELSA